jgi:hypothetical protein
MMMSWWSLVKVLTKPPTPRLSKTQIQVLQSWILLLDISKWIFNAAQYSSFSKWINCSIKLRYLWGCCRGSGEAMNTYQMMILDNWILKNRCCCMCAWERISHGKKIAISSFQVWGI